MVKRVYEGKQVDDGVRILVDKLCPRGLRLTAAGVDEWIKDLAQA